MTSALLRVTPAWTLDWVYDPRKRRASMLERGAIHQVRPGEEIPVVVDHSLGNRIGIVREFAVFDDVVGSVVQPWHFASVELTEVPDWLEAHRTGVSWSYKPIARRSVEGIDVVGRCFIEEVSILSPLEKPAEPAARVTWVDRQPAGEVLWGTGEKVRRVYSTTITVR